MFVAVFLRYAPEYCPVIFKFHPLEFTVTPDCNHTVTCQAPNCSNIITTHTAKASFALVGTVRVVAHAFVSVISFQASHNTGVYDVPVCAFISSQVVFLVVVKVCAPVKVFDTSFFVVSAS